MGKVTLGSLADLEQYVGKEIGVSDWHTVTQKQIQAFADATLDQQWIHTDPARARTESPFGTTIAHGYLTLSLAPYLLAQVIDIKNLKMGVYYGMESLRFMEPVKVDSKIRARVELIDLKNLKGTAKCTFKISFELENVKKPACVAEVIYLYQF